MHLILGLVLIPGCSSYVFCVRWPLCDADAGQVVVCFVKHPSQHICKLVGHHVSPRIISLLHEFQSTTHPIWKTWRFYHFCCLLVWATPPHTTRGRPQAVSKLSPELPCCYRSQWETLLFSPKKWKERKKRKKWKNTWFLDLVPLWAQFWEKKHCFGVGFSQVRRDVHASSGSTAEGLLSWPQIILFSLKWTFLGLRSVGLQLNWIFNILSRHPLLLDILFCLFWGLMGILRWDADKKRSVFLFWARVHPVTVVSASTWAHFLDVHTQQTRR